MELLHPLLVLEYTSILDVQLEAVMSSWLFPWKPIRSFLFSLILMGMLSGSAAASDSPTLFAKSGFNKYWASFKDYWANVYRSQGAVTMIVLGTGAVSMFIITRGKWRK